MNTKFSFSSSHFSVSCFILENSMKFDLYNSNNFWVVMIGSLVFYPGMFACNQMQVQRTCSMPSLEKAKQ